MYRRFSCSIDGNCEEDAEGQYSSLTLCSRECSPHPMSRDTADIVYEYDPANARYLPPRDRIRIIKKITGLTVRAEDTIRVLSALGELPAKGVGVAYERVLWTYLQRIFSSQVFEEALYDLGTDEAFVKLQELLPAEQLDYKRMYVSALTHGNCDLADYLQKNWTDATDLEVEEIQYLEGLPYVCVLQHLLDVYGNEYYNPQGYFMIGAATHYDVELAVRILHLRNIDYDAIMETAAREGGLLFLRLLAEEGYYQSPEQARKYGERFYDLAVSY